ncbi:tetratricopeptide repeat protein [Caldalkalibacillus mannanilyticus]|uniref:tetratricopeptide repeat protein n=1 Tax=Caldalkalibacillus mannanilyticus TaxID=1418 RepID=UPI00046A47FC|nr:tetratricopeptide repeat protein [Caldalkalibacillus mannanilyticus]
MRSELTKAIALRNERKFQESNEILTELALKYPDDPEINYHCAWSFDVLGKELEAVPYYEKAISQGLAGEDLEGACIGLGSTYRVIGQYEKSREVLERGIRLFPANKAIQAFYSMTLFNTGQHDKAMELLLKSLVETSSDKNIQSYKKAILFYSDKLEKTWI